jgi:hypothetical protein
MAVVTSRGVAPFTHKWATGQEGDTILFKTKSDAMICVITVDSVGCVSQDCVRENSNQKCKSEIIIKKLNDSTGIAVVVTIGTGPFKYKWTHGPDRDTIRYNPKSSRPGFCVVVTDANGCSSTACFATANKCISAVLVKRVNDTTAIAYVIAKGSGPFVHTWTTGQIGDSIRFNPLNKIKICVRSVDTSGCVAEACATIIPEACSGYIERSGNILYAALKNDIAKTFKWSTGSTDGKIQIKEKGEYCVSITGVLGCETRVCITVKEIDTTECTAEIIATKLPAGGSDAKSGYKLSINSKFPLKYVSWNTGETTPSITVNKTGEYCVSISDNVRCKMYICKKIELGADSCTLKIKVDSIPASSNQIPKKVKLTALPSFDAKILVWSTGETNKSIMVEKSGQYCVTVSNGIGCKLQECVKVELGTDSCTLKIKVDSIPASSNQIPKKVKLTALPSFDSKILEWSTGEKNKSIMVEKSVNIA